jgi:hypothetical protein
MGRDHLVLVTTCSLTTYLRDAPFLCTKVAVGYIQFDGLIMRSPVICTSLTIPTFSEYLIILNDLEHITPFASKELNPILFSIVLFVILFPEVA